MWIRFSIPIEFNEQKRAIRGLKPWIQELERDRRISGFAFNHYFGERRQAYLRLRFDLPNEALINDIESELQNKLIELNIITQIERDVWNDNPEYVRRAYEIGSRMAFTFFELLDYGRIDENYLTDNRDALTFQRHMNHGLMNSLGLAKYPIEAFVHLALLNETLIQVFGTEVFNLAAEYVPIPIQFKQWIQKIIYANFFNRVK